MAIYSTVLFGKNAFYSADLTAFIQLLGPVFQCCSFISSRFNLLKSFTCVIFTVRLAHHCSIPCFETSNLR